MRTIFLSVTMLILSSLEHGFSQNEVVPFYILLGQSNIGWASANDMNEQQATLFGGTIPMTYIWNPGVGSYTAIWQPMNVGTNTRCENFTDTSQFGSEASLFSSLQRQQSKTILVYKQGQGGTTLAWDWRPPLPGLPLYTAGGRWRQLTEWLTLAISQAASAGYKLDLRAIIWMQGEDDSYFLTDAIAYLDNLDNFFTNIDIMWQEFANLYGFPNSSYKKVIGRIYAPTSYPFRDIVRACEESFCNNPANNAILINTDNYPLQDWVHYSATGQVQFGLDIFNALGGNVPLPVTFINFRAVRKGANVQLDWSVAAENNIDKYEVEKSADGVHFATLAQLPVGGGTAGSYSYIDKSVLKPQNFYRIKAAGKSNEVRYTSVIKVNGASNNASLSLYPNPAAGNKAFVHVSELTKGRYAITVYHYNGQKVSAIFLQHNGGELNKEVQLSGLAKGMYKVVLTGDEIVLSGSLLRN